MNFCSLRTVLLCTCLLGAGAGLQAQGRGPGGGGPGGGSPGGGGMGGGSMPGPGGGPSYGQPRSNFPTAGSDGRGGPPRPGSGSNGTDSTMRGGLQLGPPGRWWDDRSFAKTLGLRKDQQKKMDAVFNSSKGSILENYRSLQKAESRLEKVTKEVPLDEARIFAGIDAVAQARAALEKSNAHMLLMVRQEMDPEQISTMDKFRDRPSEE
jgi:Spy/CpxP family protein refolding chaperone